MELLQLPFAVRATDIDDLLLNTLGAAIGFGIWRLFHKNADDRKNTENPPSD